MGTRPVATGPIGERARQRLADLREDRRLTLAQLSERLAELGRPILATGLSKIEKGERRVDVDDLVALAVALDVSPNVLLMPPGEGDRDAPVELTSVATVPLWEAWMWAVGLRPLTFDDSEPHNHPAPDEVADPESLSLFTTRWGDRLLRFLRAGHPYSYSDSAEHGRLVAQLQEASREIDQLRAELRDLRRL